jgi:hypothetical protein
MDIAHAAIWLIVVLMIIGIVCWFLKEANPPRPVVLFIYGAMCIFAIIALVDVAGGSHILIR